MRARPPAACAPRAAAPRGVRAASWVLVLCLISCGSPPPDGAKGDRPAAAKLEVRRIILVTLDALRADHLGCYNYPRDTSPFIDGLAREGAVFERAFTAMPMTAPAHASLFTSLYPLQHQVMKNGHVLDSSFVTLAELARGRGYSTGAFVSAAYPFTAGDLLQGFEVFGQAHSRARRPADQTIDNTLRWLAHRRPDERFLLWVHLFDTHQPLAPPARHVEAFTGLSGEAREAHARYLLARQHVDFAFHGRDTQRMLRLIDAYDASVRFVDEQLQRLFTELRQRGLDADSLWLVTSDHGEGLGNHAWLEHGENVYNELVRVPMILRFSSGAFRGMRIDEVVEHVDVLPTLAELMDAKWRRQPLPVQGASLLGLLSSPDAAPRGRLAFSQRRYHDRGDDEAAAQYALQDRAHKYIHHVTGGDEFYDLTDDPYEVDNLVGRGGEPEAALKQALLRKIELLKAGRSRSEPRLANPEALEQLKALGYVN